MLGCLQNLFYLTPQGTQVVIGWLLDDDFMVKLFGRRVPLHSAVCGASCGEPWFVHPVLLGVYWAGGGC
jgi:hypothetical protein